MKSYEDLEVWKKAIVLSKQVYGVTQPFPKEEQYGLASQMRRAVVSIASNLAEGSGRNSEKEFLRFISMARGSACELKTQAIIAHEVGYLDEVAKASLIKNIDEITRMLSGLRNSLEARNSQLTTRHYKEA